MIPDWTKADLTAPGNAEAGIPGGQSSWEVVYLGGMLVPGVSLVSSKLPSSLDKQKPKGAKKARLVDTGEHPIEFDIKVTMLPEELDIFMTDIVPILHLRAKNHQRQPLAIVHPQARIWNVTQVMIADVSIPTPTAGSAITCEIKAMEYRPPEKQKKVAQPKPADDGFEDPISLTSRLRNNRPSASGEAMRNFSSPDDLQSLP